MTPEAAKQLIGETLAKLKSACPAAVIVVEWQGGESSVYWSGSRAGSEGLIARAARKHQIAVPPVVPQSEK